MAVAAKEGVGMAAVGMVEETLGEVASAVVEMAAEEKVAEVTAVQEVVLG